RAEVLLADELEGVERGERGLGELALQLGQPGIDALLLVGGEDLGHRALRGVGVGDRGDEQNEESRGAPHSGASVLLSSVVLGVASSSSSLALTQMTVVPVSPLPAGGSSNTMPLPPRTSRLSTSALCGPPAPRGRLAARREVTTVATSAPATAATAPVTKWAR